MDFYDRYRTAELAFEQRRYSEAAELLGALFADITDAASSAEPLLGTGEARLLHARSLYHSAQLARAESAARALVEQDPTDAYAALLLSRTLRRRGQVEAADE